MLTGELLKKWGVIHQQLKVDHVFSELAIDYKPVTTSHGNELLCKCPFHNEKTPSFYYSTDTHVYRCWGASCKKSGRGFVKIFAHVRGLSYSNALDLLYSRCEASTENVIFNSRRQPVIKKVDREIKAHLPDEYQLIDYDSDNPYWWYLSERKVTEELADFYSIGYCDRGYYCGRVVIPLEFEGHIVSYLARRIFDSKRTLYKQYFLDRLAEYEKYAGPHKDADKKVLYAKGPTVGNYIYNYDNVDRKLPLIVVEGVFDFYAVKASGYDNVVANLGTNVSVVNAHRYYEFPELWAIPDKDDSSGYALWYELKDKGANRKVYLVEIPEGTDPADVNDLGRYIEQKRLSRIVNRKYFVRTINKNA